MTPLACPGGEASGGGAAARPSLKPHDAQNLLFGGFGCSHCGHMTRGVPPAAAGAGGATAGAWGRGAASGPGAPWATAVGAAAPGSGPRGETCAMAAVPVGPLGCGLGAPSLGAA